MDVDSVADELYGVAPREFTALRDARVKQARADGDRAAATEIAALRKPTVVAWLANQLARQHPDQIEPLIGLGAALREATATLHGPELRQLSSQRQQLVHALVRQARALGQQAGQRVTEDVARGLEDTFTAALADPAAAERLVRGRLSDGMAVHGFDGAVGGASPPPSSPAASASGKTSRGKKASKGGPSSEDVRRAEQRAQLEHDLGEAWAQARAAADARDEAVDAAEQTHLARTEADRTVARLRTELDEAEAARDTATREDDRAQAARDRDELAAQAARQRVSELQSRLDGL